MQTEQGCRRAPQPQEGPQQGREHREPGEHTEAVSPSDQAQRLGLFANTDTVSEEGFITLLKMPQKQVKGAYCRTTFNYLTGLRKTVKPGHAHVAVGGGEQVLGIAPDLSVQLQNPVL